MESIIDRIDIKNPAKEDLALLLKELEVMKKTDIRMVKKEDLVEIEDVVIDRELPILERILSYVRQVRNPYCYLCHGVIVKVSMTGEKDINECLIDAMFGCGHSI